MVLGTHIMDSCLFAGAPTGVTRESGTPASPLKGRPQAAGMGDPGDRITPNRFCEWHRRLLRHAPGQVRGGKRLPCKFSAPGRDPSQTGSLPPVLFCEDPRGCWPRYSQLAEVTSNGLSKPETLKEIANHARQRLDREGRWKRVKRTVIGSGTTTAALEMVLAV